MRRSGPAAWYSALGDYLAQQAAAGQRRVVLPFAEIEATIAAGPPGR